MAGEVTWSGISPTTIISKVEGVFDFAPGTMERAWSFRRPLRAVGEIAKDHGADGCDHNLKCKFLNVSVANVLVYRSRLQSMMFPSGGGNPVSGTLTVPDYGTFNHCVCRSVSEGFMTPRAPGVVAPAGGSPYGVTPNVNSYDVEFDVVFRQIRR